MAGQDHKDKSKAGKPPEHVFHALFATSDDKVELLIKVADKAGVKAYGFAFDGAPVPMNANRGKFFATKGQKKLLEWVMLGDPGGTMKVTVTLGAETLKEREKSTIQPPLTKGYDAFEIEVQ